MAKPLKIDLQSDRFMTDPVAAFADLRQYGQVVCLKLPIIGKVWMTLGYESTKAMLKDDQQFAMRKQGRGGGKVSPPGMQWWMPRSVKLLANNMLSNDNPDHKRLRGMVDQAFQRRAVHQMRGDVETIANQLLDEVEPVNGAIDIVATYCRRLPLLVIAELLGLAPRRRAPFLKQAQFLSGNISVFGFLKMIPALGKMQKIIRSQIEETAQSSNSINRDGSLIALLIDAQDHEGRLSDDELIAMVFLLLLAGHETTTHLIANSIIALEDNPDQKSAFLAAPDNSLAIEELLRFCSPVQFSKPRRVQQDQEFFGAELKSGNYIMAGLAAANCDPAQFNHPEKLDLARKPNPHVEFGTGIHFCLGFQLARLELDIALTTLYKKYPELAILGAPKWGRRTGIRSVEELNLVLK